MALSIENDPGRPSGGHAILRGAGLAGVTALSVENVSSGLFLDRDGRWAKQPFAFAVSPAPGEPDALSLGPALVDLVPDELQVALRTHTGAPLGRLFWADIIPSRGGREVAPPETPEQEQIRAQREAEARERQAREEAERRAREEADRQRTLEAARVKAEREAKDRDDERRAAEERVAEQRAAAEREAEERAARDRAAEEARAATAPKPADVPSGEGVELKFKPRPFEAPPKRRRRWLSVLKWTVIGGMAALTALFLIGLFVPKPPVDCAATFDPRIRQARGTTAAEMIKVGEDALAARCSAQAFTAIYAVDYTSNEAAAWYLGRFYDPNEANPVFHATTQPHPEWAATYYLPWVGISSRQTTALKLLCATDRQALDGFDVKLRRACSR